MKRFFVGFLLLAVLLAGGVSYFASASPDGLERVAGDHGMSETEKEHAAGDSPFADYGTEGVENSVLSGGLAGVAGVGVVLLVGTGVAFAVRRRKSSE